MSKALQDKALSLSFPDTSISSSQKLCHCQTSNCSFHITDVQMKGLVGFIN